MRKSVRPSKQVDRKLTLLPQMCTEDLDQGDLQRWDLAVHEDTSQVKLHLETDINVGTIDGRTPPERESTVRNLIETGALRVRQLLVSHRLLESGGLLPEQTLPSREVCTLEQCMLQNTLNTSESGDDVNPIVVQLPQLAIMSLRRPPERIATRIVRYGCVR